jgi:hypothetical protein
MLSQCTVIEILNICTDLQQTNLIKGSGNTQVWLMQKPEQNSHARLPLISDLQMLFRSVADPGSEFLSILDPGSQIRILSITDPGSASKILIILTPKRVSKLSEIWSGLDPDILPIPDPARSQNGTGSRIRIRNTACLAAGFPQEQLNPAAGWVVGGATAVEPTANPRHLFFRLFTTEYIGVEAK